MAKSFHSVQSICSSVKLYSSWMIAAWGYCSKRLGNEERSVASMRISSACRKQLWGSLLCIHIFIILFSFFWFLFLLYKVYHKIFEKSNFFWKMKNFCVEKFFEKVLILLDFWKNLWYNINVRKNVWIAYGNSHRKKSKSSRMRNCGRWLVKKELMAIKKEIYSRSPRKRVSYYAFILFSIIW